MINDGHTIYVEDDTFDAILNSYSGNTYSITLNKLFLLHNEELINFESVDGRRTRIYSVVRCEHFCENGIIYTYLEVS